MHKLLYEPTYESNDKRVVNIREYGNIACNFLDFFLAVWYNLAYLIDTF